MSECHFKMNVWNLTRKSWKKEKFTEQKRIQMIYNENKTNELFYSHSKQEKKRKESNRIK